MEVSNLTDELGLRVGGARETGHTALQVSDALGGRERGGGEEAGRGGGRGGREEGEERGGGGEGRNEGGSYS